MNRLLFLIFLSLAIIIGSSYAKEVVNVGAYDFPPFFSVNEKGEYSGVAIDMIDEMNRFQNDYEFKIFLTTANRRYIDFKKKKFDLMLFEDRSWGWKSHNVNNSIVFLKGGEVYVALKDGEKDQSFFENIEKKSIVGILGYHYGFAKFNSDVNFLKENFDIVLTKKHDIALKMVLSKRSDIAVVTISYLKMFLKENPQYKDSFLISEKLDQPYKHTVLIRESGAVSKEWIDKILAKMSLRNLLNKVWLKYNIVN